MNMKIRKVRNQPTYTITMEMGSKEEAQSFAELLEAWKRGAPSENGIYLVKAGDIFTVVMHKDGGTVELHDRKIEEIKYHIFLKPIPKDLR